MIRKMLDVSRSDPGLARLLDEAREYACVYVLARQRQKGCDGMGELAAMKEEFTDVVDRVLQYSQEKGYIAEGLSCDIDSVADRIIKGRDTL